MFEVFAILFQSLINIQLILWMIYICLYLFIFFPVTNRHCSIDLRVLISSPFVGFPALYRFLCLWSLVLWVKFLCFYSIYYFNFITFNIKYIFECFEVMWRFFWVYMLILYLSVWLNCLQFGIFLYIFGALYNWRMRSFASTTDFLLSFILFLYLYFLII